jgi:hypothetical protein
MKVHSYEQLNDYQTRRKPLMARIERQKVNSNVFSDHQTAILDLHRGIPTGIV